MPKVNKCIPKHSDGLRNVFFRQMLKNYEFNYKMLNPVNIHTLFDLGQRDSYTQTRMHDTRTGLSEGSQVTILVTVAVRVLFLPLETQVMGFREDN